MSTVSAPTSEWDLRCLIRRTIDLQTQFSSAQGHSHRAGDGGICQEVRGEVRHWLRLALAVGIKWICHLWINSKDFHASEKTLFLHSFLMLQEIRHFHI